MTARYTRGILAVAGLFTAAPLLHAQTAPPLQIVTDSLPLASVGAAYNQQLITSGGVCSSIGAVSSTIDSGALPPGLFVTSPPATEQWSIQGTPTAAGNFNFTVHVRWTHARVSPFDHDCVDEAVKALTLAVQANPTLAADRPQLTTTYHTGHFPPIADSVQVTAAGGAAVAIAVQSATDSGGLWLSVMAQSAATPAALTISYSVSGLAAGTYTGRVIVTTGGLAALTIPVTLVVVTDTNIPLQATPSPLAFSAIAGGPDPPGQSLKVTVAGDNVIFQASVSAAPPNGKWLTVTPSAAATPATLTVAVTAKDLAAGPYNGTLTLSVGGIPNSSLTIPVTFTIQAPGKPTIAAGGVVNAAGLGSAIAPGTWVTLYGTSLSATTRAWRDADFSNGLLPTSLDGISVTIDGKPAAVYFISPLQINVLAPDDTTTGPVPVQAKNAQGTSDSVLVPQQTAAPALFQLRAANANYAAGTHADGSLLAGPALIQQGFKGSAARAGETIVLFGTGFGVTQPPISATALVPAPYLPLAHPEDLHVRIGGFDAVIAFAGLISPGVYQFNVVVPPLAAGDQSVVAQLRDLLTQTDLLLTIQP